MKIFYPPLHKQHDPPFEGYTNQGNLPAYETAARAETVRAALQAQPWAEFTSPPDFGPEPIATVHSHTYIEYLRSAYQAWQIYSPVPNMAFIPGTYGIDYEQARARSGFEQEGFFLLDNTMSIAPKTFQAAQQAAHCALAGAQAIGAGERAAFALSRPPGHHAGQAIGGGYCYFNNAAVAAQWLSQGSKVAILDVDYHAGNGTQEIFYQRPDVLTVSLHADPAFEYPHYAGFAEEMGAGPGVGFHRNFPLPAGTDPNRYFGVLAEALELITLFGPKHLIVSAGMDTSKDDPLGTFQLTPESIHRIGEHIAALNLPTLIVMEGGYHLPTLGTNFVAFLEPFG